MLALVLHRLAHLEPGTEDIAVADLKVILAVGDRFGSVAAIPFSKTRTCSTPLRSSNTMRRSLPTTTSSRALCGIRPAHMDVADDVSRGPS